MPLSDRTDGTAAVLGGTATAAVLVVALLLRTPTAFQASGARDALSTLLLLTLFAALALPWRRARSSELVLGALRVGAPIGFILVAIELLNLGLEHLVGNSTVSAIRGVTAWCAIFLAFGSAGAAAVHEADFWSSALRRSIIASAWSGILAALGAVCGGLLLATLFMPAMIRIFVPIATKASDDPRALVVRHTFGAAMQHLLLLPIVAVGFGVTGAIVTMLLARVSRHTARRLALLAGVIALTGLMALRVATGLPRSARPPYVSGGLLALGLSLASAYALSRATRGAARAGERKNERPLGWG